MKKENCLRCDRPKYFDLARGWIHAGGTAYIMECPACHWKGFQPASPLTYATDICPKCGVQGKLRDNHIVQ